MATLRSSYLIFALALLSLHGFGVCEVKKKPTKKEEDKKAKLLEAARKKLAECKMMGLGSLCDEAFEKATGLKLPKNSKAAGQLEAKKAASMAVADLMKACNLTLSECQQKVRESLANLTGRVISKREADFEIKKAGIDAAGEAIKSCVKAAKSAEEKAACRTGPAAKAALAKALGKNVSDIKDIDLQKAAQEGAVKGLKERIEACKALVNSSADKAACFKNKDDLKDVVAEAMGKLKSALKDSDVKKFIEKGAQDEALLALKSCNKTANATACKELARQTFLDATGKSKKDLDDHKLKRSMEKALSAELGDRMSACVEAAGTNKTELMLCRTMVAAEMKSAALDSKMPTAGEIEQMLKNSAKSKALEVAENCKGSRSECMELAKEQMAKAMGKAKDKIRDLDAEKFNKEAALKASVDLAKSCFEAKKENSTSSCTDVYEEVLKLRKKSKPSGADAQKADKSDVRKELAKTMAKDFRASCLQQATKAAAEECLASFKEEAENMAKQLFPNYSPEMRKSRMKHAEKEASIEAVGESFAACMVTASNATEKDACKAEFSRKKSMANLSEPDDDILSKFHMSAVVEAGRTCNSTQRKECMKAVKADMMKLGMLVRRYAKMKRLGEFKAAAEAWASCKDANNTETACDALAKARFEEVSGSSGSWTDELKAKIQKLGKALYNGQEMKFSKLKRVQVDTFTSSTVCSEVEMNKTLSEISKHSNSSGKAYETILIIGCRLVEGLAEHQFHVKTPNLTDSEIDSLSDHLATNLNGTSLSRRLRLKSDFQSHPRRLGAITESNADVAVQLDPSGSDTEKSSQGTDGTAGAGLSSGIMTAPASFILMGVMLMTLW
eukprot:TRINITY_DN598_c0_g1_i1.p1 TRINITY_DN598_c0_g1~~TRINITY_DN598_c0_g1_i1.p1  ORF type:complete len:871 (-),score=291.80 TRINITY_DN598_c0_g1_i1:347-2884(-)